MEPKAALSVIVWRYIPESKKILPFVLNFLDTNLSRIPGKNNPMRINPKAIIPLLSIASGRRCSSTMPPMEAKENPSIHSFHLLRLAKNEYIKGPSTNPMTDAKKNPVE